MGFLMQTTMLITQNSVQQKDLGVASSAAMFFRSIGGSFGVSLFGAVFNSRLSSELGTRLGAAGHQFTSGGSRVDPHTLQQLPAPLRTAFLESLAAAISSIFSWAILFAVALPFLAIMIKHIPLRGAQPAQPTPAAAEDVAAQDAQESTAIAALE
jgi:hypothetical protein